MGLTLTTTPNIWTPLNAEIWFSSTSTNSNISGFKYIYTLNKEDKTSGTKTSLGSYKLPSRPITGEGLFTPHKLLRSEVSYDLNPFTSTIMNATNSVIKWDLSVGYEEETNLNITNIGNSTTPDPNHLLLYVTGVSLGFQIADIITLSMNSPYFFDTTNTPRTYNGTQSVKAILEIFGTTVLELDASYITPSTVPAYTTGKITNLQRLNATQSGPYYSFNGTRQYDQIGIDFGSLYVPTTSTASNNYSPLTNYKNSKNIYLNQYETLNFIIDVNSFTTPTPYSWSLHYTFYYDDGSAIITNTIQLNSHSDPNMKEYVAPVGTQNIIDAHIAPSHWDDVSYYIVELKYNPYFYGGTYYTKWSKTYNIVKNCSPYPHNFRIAFQNRLGGFDYWNFNWRSTNIMTTNKTEWRQTLPYNYTVGMRNDAVLANKAQETWTISSDWITEYDSNYLKECVSTLEAYFIDETTKKFYPIIIQNDSYVVKTSIDNKLFAVSINFRYGFDINLQQN